MAGELGRFTGQLILDVKQAVAAYTEARQEHLSTVSALGAGAGAFVRVGTALTAAGVGMAAGLFTAAKAAGEFERQLDFFGAVSGATQKEMDAVRKKALQLNRDTIYTAGEIGDAFTELAKAGASAGDILEGVGEAVINLGAATDMPLSEAATSLTSILNTFQISAEDSVKVVDQLAGAANASSIDVQDLILTMTYAGASAKVAGIEFDDINTAIALLGERGIRGSKAGTGLRQMLNKLISPTKKGTGALKELGIITADGTNNLLEMDGSLKPLPKILDIINTATDGLTASEKTNVLGRIFPITALPTILSLLDGGAEGMARLSKEIGKTTAAEVASERLDNLSGDIEYLVSSAENLMITLGALVQGPMRALIQAITAVLDWLAELDPAWLSLLTTLVAVGSAILLAIGFFGLFAGAILNIMQVAIQLKDVFNVLIKVIPGLAFAIGKLKAAMLFPGTPIIALILAIAGVLVYFFTQTEKGQQVWGQLMTLFQQGVAMVMPLLSQFATILGDLLTSALTALIPLLQVVGDVLMTVLAPFIPIITNMLTLLGAAFSGIGSDLSGFAAIAEVGAQILSGIISAIPIILTALVEIIIVIVDSIVGWAPMILSAALTVFLNLITALNELMGPVTNAIIQLIAQLVTALIGMLPTLINGMMTLLNGLIVAVVTIIPLLIAAALNLILSLVAALVSMIPTLIEAGIQLFMGILEAIPVILPPLIDAVINMVLSVITSFIEMLPTLLDAGIMVFMALVDAVIQIVPDLIVQIINLLPTIIAVLITLIPALLNGAIQLFLALVKALPKIIPQLVNAIIGLIPVIVKTVIGLIPQLIDAAVKLFMGIAQAVVKVIPRLVESLVSMGKQLIQGLANGIANGAKRVMDAIGNVVNGAINWAKGLLGIKSPSRVFRTIGDNTIKGMIIGITNQAPALQRSFGMIEDSLDKFYDQVYAAREFDVMMNLQSQMGVSASDGLSAKFDALNETLAEIANKDTVVVEKMEVNNPEPEKPSESLPKGIRKAAYMVG